MPLMVDIETMGTAPNAAIMSLGAVMFDDQRVWAHFYAHIELQSSLDAGLTVDASTILWWLEQSEAARTELARPGKPLVEVLKEFADAYDWDGLEVWCNGASFDFPVLRSAYKACGMVTPWSYYNERDYRTARNLVPRKVYERCKVSPETAHSALSDATAQAMTLQLLRQADLQAA